MRLHSAVLLLLVGSLSVVTLRAQGPTTSGVVPSGVDLRMSADGYLRLSTSSVALEDVIRAVAGTLDLQVRTVGAAPRELVSVAFENRLPLDVLRELMDPSGISFLISDSSATKHGRLIMGRFPEGTQSVPRLLQELSKAADDEPALNSPSAPTGTAPAQTAGSGQPLKPTEWPAGLEPINPGTAAPIAQSAEELYMMVNGRPEAPYTGPMSPNPNGAPGVWQTVTADATRLGGANAKPSQRPGVAAPGAATPALATTPNIGPAAPPDPAMMKAPEVIYGPGPPMIVFQPSDTKP